MGLPAITFIINGAKRKGRRMAASLERAFRDYPVAVVFTAYSGHATLLAAEAVRAGARIVVSVGGDGTLNEVVKDFIANRNRNRNRNRA